jgi:WD40 repeat protein
MLKQIGLLQSGAQTHIMNATLHFSEERIIYASSLAVYVLNADTYMVERILCSNQKSITSLSVSSVDKNLLVVGSVEGIITVWNIEEEAIVRRIAVSFPVTTAWDPFSSSVCHTLSLDGVRLYSWYVAFDENTHTNCPYLGVLLL